MINTMFTTRSLSLRLPKGKNPARYQLDLTRPVRVYRNLTRDCYSIQQDGLVKAHAAMVALEDVAWTVGQKGRLRVIREQAKNVHAFAVGYLVQATTALDAAQVWYNPYKVDSFRCDLDWDAPLTKSDGAYLNVHGQSFALWKQEGER